MKGSVPLGYPRVVDRRANLREVAPRLYIGNALAPVVMAWWCAIDVHGAHEAVEDVRLPAYARIPVVLRAPFMDGGKVPVHVLSVATALYRVVLMDCHTMVISCAAGISRSASVAYAVMRTVHGMSHDEALRRVRDPESCAPLEETLASAREWVRHGGGR